jgi:DNA repair protein RadA/Sms
VRASPHMGLRLKEAAKLGFTSAVMPTGGELPKELQGARAKLKLRRISHLKDLAAGLGPCD